MNNIISVPFWATVFTRNDEGDFILTSVLDLFESKRVAIIAVPGAFASKETDAQVVEYDESYYDICFNDVDEVYCVSVNDPNVMSAWFDHLEIDNLEMICDGNGDFTSGMGMMFDNRFCGMGMRSWRYSAIIDNGYVEAMFKEQLLLPIKTTRTNVEFIDTIKNSKAEVMLSYLENKKACG